MRKLNLHLHPTGCFNLEFNSSVFFGLACAETIERHVWDIFSIMQTLPLFEQLSSRQHQATKPRPKMLEAMAVSSFEIKPTQFVVQKNKSFASTQKI